MENKIEILTDKDAIEYIKDLDYDDYIYIRNLFGEVYIPFNLNMSLRDFLREVIELNIFKDLEIRNYWELKRYDKIKIMKINRDKIKSEMDIFYEVVDFLHKQEKEINNTKILEVCRIEKDEKRVYIKIHSILFVVAVELNNILFITEDCKTTRFNNLEEFEKYMALPKEYLTNK